MIVWVLAMAMMQAESGLPMPYVQKDKVKQVYFVPIPKPVAKCTVADLGQPYGYKGQSVDHLYICTARGWAEVDCGAGQHIENWKCVDDKPKKAMMQQSPSKEEACLMEHGEHYCAMMQQPEPVCVTKDGTTPISDGRGKCLQGKPDAMVLPKPLKCDKYQHMQDGWNASGEYVMWCADDLHTLTEKEWQELMERLHKLEFPFPVNVKQEK